MCVCVSFFFWLFLQHTEAPWPGTECKPKLWPTPQLQQMPDPNPLCHSEDSYVSLFQCYMMTLNIRDKDIFINYSSLFSFFVFLEPNLWHMEVPGKGSNRSCSHWPIPQPQQLGIRAVSAIYTTTHSKASVCNLHHLNPLSEARDQTRILRDTSQVCH